MVHDRIAEELEAKGFYRRASARWGEVMQLGGDRQGTASGYDATAGMFQEGTEATGAANGELRRPEKCSKSHLCRHGAEQIS